MPSQFEVNNDLYGFTGQFSDKNSTENTHEEYDLSNKQKAHDPSYRKSNLQGPTADKRNTILTDNPLYGESNVYDGTEIYINVNSDTYNAQMGIDEEYNYCKH